MIRPGSRRHRTSASPNRWPREVPQVGDRGGHRGHELRASWGCPPTGFKRRRFPGAAGAVVESTWSPGVESSRRPDDGSSYQCTRNRGYRSHLAPEDPAQVSTNRGWRGHQVSHDEHDQFDVLGGVAQLRRTADRAAWPTRTGRRRGRAVDARRRLAARTTLRWNRRAGRVGDRR